MTAAKEWAAMIPPEDRHGLIRQLAWLAEKDSAVRMRRGSVAERNRERRAAAIRAAIAVLEEAGREGGSE